MLLLPLFRVVGCLVGFLERAGLLAFADEGLDVGDGQRLEVFGFEPGAAERRERASVLREARDVLHIGV